MSSMEDSSGSEMECSGGAKSRNSKKKPPSSSRPEDLSQADLLKLYKQQMSAKTPIPPKRGNAKKKRPKFSNEVVPRVVLLGATGSGKSHLGNALLGEDIFVVSDNPESCTLESSDLVRGFWLGNESDGREFEIIDTPGLNDSEGRDTEHIQNIVENLKEHNFVNLFLIVRNGREVRMTNTYTDMLRTFEMIFGDHFWNHAVFDVSRDLGEKDKKTAKKWVKEMRNKFPGARRVKTVFLDVEEEDSAFCENVEDLWQSCSKMPNFECKDIKIVMQEKDRLQSEKEDAVAQKDQLEAEKENAVKKIESLKKANSKELQEFEDKFREAEKKREEEKMISETNNQKEMYKLLEEVKNKDAELFKISNDKNAVVMEKDFQLKAMEIEKRCNDKFEEEKGKLIAQYEHSLKAKDEEYKLQIDAKVKEERERDMEQSATIESFKVKIQELARKNDYSEVASEAQKKFDVERKELIEKHNREIEKYQDKIKNYEDQRAQQSTMKQKEEHEKIRKKDEEVKEHLLQQNEAYANEKYSSEEEFQAKYPSLFSNKVKENPTAAVTLFSMAKNTLDRFQTDIQIPLKTLNDIKNRTGGIAARIFETNYPQNMSGGLLSNWFGTSTKETKIKKTLMVLGITGCGKTTFLDSLINYIFDVRYEDPYRLKLIRMTKDEQNKSNHQAMSQTDHIVVYKIKSLPGMRINYELTVVDTPGFGDTRGVSYDKKLMQNIEDLFKSKAIKSLDAIGFVAKSGDARLTAQQNYIFQSIFHIFGKDVENNLISVLTNYDGQSVNILDSFEEANMNFVENFPINSRAIFQPFHGEKPIDRSILISQPMVAQYQQFFVAAQRLTDAVSNMAPKSLEQTIQVLDDRERIQVELQGVQERVMELLLKKDQIQKEKDICDQHAANASANENTEYEVEEQIMKKVQLAPGTYVTNCLQCNRTCHFPCAYANDADKERCSAMQRGKCTVCPSLCHWKQHINNEYRIVFETNKVKKTYEEIVERHANFIAQHKGQMTVVDALQAEADAASKEIQDSVPRITNCLKNLQETALRPNMSSSADYLEQMISAEEHERKPGYRARIKQLMIEKDKARMLTLVAEGKDVMNAKV